MSSVTRRHFVKLAAASGGVIALGGCAPWEQADSEHALDHLLHDATPSRLEWRLVNRLGYGPRPGDLEKLRSLGAAAFIDEQLHPEAIVESPDLLAALDGLETLSLSPEAARDRETEWEGDEAVTPVIHKLLKTGKEREPNPGPVRNELVQATVLQAAFSSRQLQQVMTEFWRDHFNISFARGECRWLKTADDRMLREHALGRFRDLLGASVRSPAMLSYLDAEENRRSDPSGGVHRNENYGRELLELHTLGDPGAYSQRDVQETARILTGLSYGAQGAADEGEFVFRAADHDDGEKIVLGQRFSPGRGMADIEQLLDFLAAHPLTARSITKKLCQQFLGSAPPELHERLVGFFRTSGGDIRVVLAELLHSREFSAGSQPQLKRPFQFAISSLRMLGARTSGAGIGNFLAAMGQQPFAWPRPDGYPHDPAFWSSGLSSRWKFAIALADNRIEETWINFGSLERALRGRDLAASCRQLYTGLIGSPPAEDLVRALTGLSDKPAEALPQWMALVLMSPQFQWC